jgi:hypothetical protein
MSEKSSPLTPEQWEARDYRQAARELDSWARERARPAHADDSTEYVAKLGLDESGSVIVMNRAHDRVLIPPPARAVLAAFALVEQPFGFSAADVDVLERAAAGTRDEALAAGLRDLGGRLRALLPPAAT